MALQSREAGGQVEGSSARSRLATRGSLFRSERVHGARKRLLLGNARPRLTPSTSACRRQRGSALYDASVSPIDADDPARLPEGARLAVEPGRKRLTRCLRPGRAWDRRACQRKVARPTSSPTAQRLLEAPRGPGRLIPRPIHRSRAPGVALPPSRRGLCEGGLCGATPAPRRGSSSRCVCRFLNYGATARAPSVIDTNRQNSSDAARAVLSHIAANSLGAARRCEACRPFFFLETTPYIVSALAAPCSAR